MVTRLGLGTFGVGWAVGVPGYPQPGPPLDHFSFLQYAHSLGLRLVQFGDNLPLHMLNQDRRAELRRLADQLGVAVEVGTRGINPAHLSAYLRLAHEFGSPILRLVVDTADDHPAPYQIVERLRSVLPECRSAGITLAVENHDRFKARTLADIITALDDPCVGICLDTVNSFGALEGPDVVIDTLGPYVVNLHVKDFVVRRSDHHMGFIVTGAPAGQGMLDIPDLLSRLAGWGRSVNAIIETWLEPNLINMKATIEREASMVEESVRYLRQYIRE
ncbi:sugar phosphate isomerase/epimerase family protein [Kamptonema cortianum]|nr:sugar phosphate isomerase/epimerase family protein [Kamptonema cortianum]